ncbi:dual specificity protein phosphatase [Paenibacillus curdlanolyticus YK9]|uniref:Dual specificity protein phosphatase n=1 Tax=Paenibacillus curdlanolyticus YK9 TaxID=717606 RepID=E0I5R7_9BACL|nr:dual specificity protein phosphatase family protein [Paenibacillus curdlanolyticus]EFM12309.1 dual specificity protein phosphatase [Paenibacillus curdlanolyticus YK9]
MNKDYHALVDDRIYMGGAADVKDAVTTEKCDIIVDLREEATECAYSEDQTIKWIKVGIGDNAKIPQEDLFHQAIEHVVNAYRNGKKVMFHCGGGKGRTGAVAIGTLLTLGKASTIDEAEKMAQKIRPVINIREPQREALKKLFTDK